MTLLKEIINFLNLEFPLELAEKWDPTGPLFLFDENSKIRKITLCLDLTDEILNEAIISESNLIITHHPFVFNSTLKEEYKQAPYKRKMIKKIKTNKINVISLHTNFDGKNNSTAYAILNQLNLSDSIKILDQYNLMIEHNTNFEDFVKLLKSNLNLNNLQTNVDKNYKIKNIAILPGSGGIEAALLALKNKADLIISSDFKWSDLLNLLHYPKMKLLIVPHLIEQFFINTIFEKLQNKFKIEIDKKWLKEIVHNI